MALKNLLLLSVLTLCLIACTTAERNELNNIKPGQDLAARLHYNAGRVMECWNALVKLKYFSNVIVKFFLTGQTSNITPECCRAVVILVHNCWPTDLTSLGFTPEEANILGGYCDVTSSPVASPPADARLPFPPADAPLPFPPADAVSPFPPAADVFPAPLPSADSPISG